MNDKNLAYLKDGLQYTGFGARLNEDLEKQMRQQLPAFELKTEIPYYNATVAYTLHFRKSDQLDMYFFNKYDATLKTDRPEQEKSHTFYIHQNSGITAREAFNLLSGRAVHKELTNTLGEPYKAWLQLSPEADQAQGKPKLRQFHENYGFDLEKTLRPYAIREFDDPQLKEQLLRSLQKGNIQRVTTLLDGQETKRFVEASPQFKSINVYDEQFRPIKRETLLRPEVTATHARSVTQKHAQQATQLHEPGTQQQQAHRKGLRP